MLKDRVRWPEWKYDVNTGRFAAFGTGNNGQHLQTEAFADCYMLSECQCDRHDPASVLLASQALWVGRMRDTLKARCYIEGT